RPAGRQVVGFGGEARSDEASGKGMRTDEHCQRKNTRTATPTRVPAPYRCGRRLCRCRCRRANRTGRPFAAARLHRAGCRAIRTARSWRGIVPFTHLAREGRMTVTIGRREVLAAL